MSEEKVFDPWGAVEVSDYEKAFERFGLQHFPDSWRKKLDHLAFRRHIVIAHRDFGRIYQRIQRGMAFINMTGIATSGWLHFGHKLIIDIFKFFKKQGALNFFAICDIDAYVSRPDVRVPSLQKAKAYAVDNLAHALALGLSKADVYVQSRMPPRYYEFAFELSKKITSATFRALYGSIDLGKVSANLLQYADILHPQLQLGKMPSITAIAIEQDPHMRAVRDIAKRLPYKFELPSAIYIVHQPGLTEGVKMSSSIPESAIFLRDSESAAMQKLSAAFTGGRETVAEQRRLGGNPDICKIYAMFKFHHPDDRAVEAVYRDCKNGQLICGDCKAACADFISRFLHDHQRRYRKAQAIAKKIIFAQG
jgi:tryptophanyl-tRNA synthetase